MAKKYDDPGSPVKLKDLLPKPKTLEEFKAELEEQEERKAMIEFDKATRRESPKE